MVKIEVVTPAKFLDLYAKNMLVDPINVKVGTEQRIYGRTSEGEANNPDTYKVVYCVV